MWSVVTYAATSSNSMDSRRYDFSPTMGPDGGLPLLDGHPSNPQYQYAPDQLDADSGYPSYTEELVDNFNDGLSNFYWPCYDPPPVQAWPNDTDLGFSFSSNSQDPILVVPVHSGTLLPEFQQQAQPHDPVVITTPLVVEPPAKEALHFCQPREYSCQSRDYFK